MLASNKVTGTGLVGAFNKDIVDRVSAHVRTA